MVGDVTLKRSDHLINVLTPADVDRNDWRQTSRYRDIAYNLQNLQVLLYLQGQEEREINLVGGVSGYYIRQAQMKCTVGEIFVWKWLAGALVNFKFAFHQLYISFAPVFNVMKTLVFLTPMAARAR